MVSTMKRKKSKKESLVLGRLLSTIAPRIGARVLLEPEWQIAGQIVFKNGKKSYFRYNSLDLNPTGASDIAKDKDYANFFMEHMGYPTVPNSKTFFSDAWAEALHTPERTIAHAYAYAQQIGFPVVVKPNSGSQGSGVSLVHTKKELYTALRLIFKSDRIALLQPVISGKDYRLVVLEDEVISAYERIPLSVIGNGRATIKTLLLQKQRMFLDENRDTQLSLTDPRIARKLAHQHLSFTSVPKKGERIFLLDNANLSTGGDSVDVTTIVHPQLKKLAVQLTKDMGLKLCGVDLMVNGDITKKPIPGEFFILEINAAPGLDHYVRTGPAQKNIVEKLYLEVLKKLEKL